MTGIFRFLLALGAILLLRRALRGLLGDGRSRRPKEPGPGEPEVGGRPADRGPSPLDDAPIEEAEYEELP